MVPVSDEPVVSVEAVKGSVVEGASVGFKVELSGGDPKGQWLNVNVSVSAVGDWRVSTRPRRVTVIPSSGSTTFFVATTDDDQDEPDGTVTATVTAGDGYKVAPSRYSATATIKDDDLPATVPGAVSGLRCSAATSDSLTVGWDSAAGAASYEVQSSALPSAPHLVPWDPAGTRSGSRYVHTFSSLGTGHVFTLAVRGVNSQDATGPVATVKCSTALRDMLTLECNANALLVAEFSDPYAGTGLTPTDYTVRITKAGDTRSTSRRVRDTFVFTGAEHGAQYTVTVTASHGTGWAQYTETDTATCPTHTDNWNRASSIGGCDKA